MNARKRNQIAERKQLERERKRRGDIVVRVVVSRQARDVLTDARWIGQWDEDDKNAVQQAVQILIDNLAPVTRDTLA